MESVGAMSPSACTTARVQLAKGPAARRRQIALGGPSRASPGEMSEHAVRIAHGTPHSRTELRHRRVHAGPRSGPRPYPQANTLAPWPELAFELLFAQLAHEIGQWDLHRAYHAALVAQGRRLWQVQRILQTDVSGRENGADRAGINPPVGVPADILIDGAVVHASTAADAAQRLPQLGSEHFCAARVDDDDVKLLRSVRITRLFRPGGEAQVVADRLGGGGACEQPQDE